MSRPIDRVIAAFSGVEQVRNRRDFCSSWKAVCPLHDDQHPSLEIDENEDGKVLVLCRVCGPEQTEAILACVRLSLQDLFPHEDAAADVPRRKIVATFDYLDEAGVLLYQACRIEPGRNGRRKDFFQRRPARIAPDGRVLEWVNNLEGVRRVLYRLPELVAAPPEAVVWIVEGERKVDTLATLGMVATCNVGGAGKWHKAYAPCFQGKRVAVLPDHDPPGQQHARQVADLLRGVAASVVIVELPGLPAKGDVLDWLAQGGTRAQLEDLYAAAKPREFPLPIPASLLQSADLAGDWLWKGYVARGAITLFSALWKSGKTTLMAHLLKACEQGGSFCGLDVQPCRVLYVTEEHESRWAERRDKLGIKDHIHFEIRPFRSKPRMDGWLRFIDFLHGQIKDKGFDLVALDTLSNLWPVKDENDNALVQEALMPLHQLTERAGVHLVHHVRKSDGNEATAARGAGALSGFVDTIIELRRYAPTDRKDRRRVLTAYGRFDETPDEVVVELTGTGYVACGSRREVSRGDLGTDILRLLPHCPPGINAEEVESEWPGSTAPARQRLLDALRNGHEQGLWHREGSGRRGSPYTFWAPPPNPFSVPAIYRERTGTEMEGPEETAEMAGEGVRP